MKLACLGVEEVEMGLLESNPLSVNIEDGATFARLKRELQQAGMIEFPVVIKDGDRNAFRVLSGHHRIRAWKELGHETISVTVLDGSLTAEEEFNLANNLNRVRGELTLGGVKRVIRIFDLDVSKLDIYKLPVQSFLPQSGASVANDDMLRKAKLRDLAMKVAEELAMLVIDHRDEDLVCFLVEDKLVSFCHVDISPRKIRRNLSVFKGVLARAVKTWKQTMDE